MFWVLKRIVSFKHPKHMLEQMGKKIFTFTLKIIVYLNPFTKDYYRQTRAPSALRQIMRRTDITFKPLGLI